MLIEPQNYHSTLAAASFILYNDRRRAFHIAITIEDTGARLWFRSRSHTICSTSFDINTVRSIPSNNA